ncbi:MAG: hypothetical protein AAGJ46_15255 [Planctomycetota bacterium]
MKPQTLLSLALPLLTASAALAGDDDYPPNAAAVMFQVDREEDAILKPPAPYDARRADEFLETQAAWIKSQYVLNAVLARTEVAELPAITKLQPKAAADRLAEWIDVRVLDGSELLEIVVAREGLPIDEAEVLAEAIGKAYYEEVAFAMHRSRMQPVEILRNSERKIAEELRRKADALAAIKKDRGGLSAAETSMLTQTISLCLAEKFRLEDELMRLRVKLDVSDGGQEVDRKLEKAIESRIATLNKRVADAVSDRTYSEETSHDVKLRELEVQSLTALQQRIADRIQMWNIESGAQERVKRIPGVQLHP